MKRRRPVKRGEKLICLIKGHVSCGGIDSKTKCIYDPVCLKIWNKMGYAVEHCYICGVRLPNVKGSGTFDSYEEEERKV